jgi:hypothetical protein
MMWRRAAGGACLLLVLAAGGCSKSDNSDVSILGGEQSNRPQPQPIRVLTQDEIQQAVSGKSFQYTRQDGNGIVSYNADGTLSFQDDVRGEGTGTWLAAEGQLCETFGSAPEQCGEFKSTGDAYHVGSGRLIEMKVQ